MIAVMPTSPVYCPDRCGLFDRGSPLAALAATPQVRRFEGSLPSVNHGSSPVVQPGPSGPETAGASGVAPSFWRGRDQTGRWAMKISTG